MGSGFQGKVISERQVSGGGPRCLLRNSPSHSEESLSLQSQVGRWKSSGKLLEERVGPF